MTMPNATITIPISEWNKQQRLIKAIAERLGIGEEGMPEWVKRSVLIKAGLTPKKIYLRRNDKNSRKKGKHYEYNKQEFLRNG